MRLLIEPYRNDRAPAGAGEAMFTALHALLGSRRALALEIHLDRRVGGVAARLVCGSLPAGARGPARGGAAAQLAERAAARVRGSRRGAARGRAPGAADASACGRGARAARRTARSSRCCARWPPPVRRPRCVVALRPAARLVELALRGARSGPQPLLWAAPRRARGRPRPARAIASALAGGPAAAGDRGAAAAGRARPPLAADASSARAELARLWSLPSPEFAAVPCVRRAVPLAPAPPGITRSRAGAGCCATSTARSRSRGAAPPARRGRRRGRAGQDLAPRRERRRGSAARGLRGDRARPQGRRGRRRSSASCRASRTCTLLDMAAPTAGFNPLAVARCARRDRRPRRRGAARALQRGRGPRQLRPLPAQRADRRARLRRRPRRCGTPRGCSRWARRGRALRARVAERLIELPAVRRARRLPRRRAAGPARRRARDDDGEARRAGQQARARAELAGRQAGAAQRLAAHRPRPADRAARGAGGARARSARSAPATSRS